MLRRVLDDQNPLHVWDPVGSIIERGTDEVVVGTRRWTRVMLDGRWEALLVPDARSAALARLLQG